MRSLLAISATTLLLAGCGQDGQDVSQTTETFDDSRIDYRKELQSKLIKAKAGDVIEIPEGTFTIDQSLSLNVDGMTIRGAGMDKSILFFKGQVAGAEGLLVNANDFVVEDLAIEDTKGDALKVNQGENIVIRRVRVEWTNGPDNKNGAYGLYPVQTENTLIEDSIGIGASPPVMRKTTNRPTTSTLIQKVSTFTATALKAAAIALIVWN